MTCINLAPTCGSRLSRTTGAMSPYAMGAHVFNSLRALRAASRRLANPHVFQKALAGAPQFAEALNRQHRARPHAAGPRTAQPMTQPGACSLQDAARQFGDPRAQVAGHDRWISFLDVFIRSSRGALLVQSGIASCSRFFAPIDASCRAICMHSAELAGGKTNYRK
jgi:hypothetical protein